MSQIEEFDKNVEEYDKWYDELPEVYQSELLSIKEQLRKLPENIRGIEVGLGTGRFAQPLGIKEGIEPSEEMAFKATKRGIEVVKGVAESMPYKAMQFDFVLFVTICYLDNIERAIEESYRVLKPKGALIMAILDKNQPVAQEYKERKKRSTFFRNARFYSVKYITDLIESKGFKDLDYNQTLFGELNEIKTAQRPKPGYGEGSFVVIKATKK
jgi:SAM-dependent methyltransferase